MKCRRCNKEFEPTANKIKKRDYICIPCVKEDNHRRLKIRQKLGLKTGGNPPPKEWWVKYYKEYYNRPGVKEHRARLMRKYRNDPILRMKHEARWQANRALKQGKIIKMNCVKCGNVKSEMHHPDYYKPLEIIWLCVKCHKLEHSKATGN